MADGMGRRRAIGALVGLGLAVGACGDESETGSSEAGQGPRAVAETFIAAVTRDDPSLACRQFVPRSAEVWFSGHCRPHTPPMLPDTEKDFRNGVVRAVRVRGPRAEVAVQTRTDGERGLILQRTDEGWKIFNLSEGSNVARQDRRAITGLNAAALAFGGYRAANGGSFAGARPRDLRRHNSAAPLNAEVTSTRNTFTVAITSRSGNVFRIRGFITRRGLIGTEGRTCRVAGVGDCPPDGTWD